MRKVREARTTMDERMQSTGREKCNSWGVFLSLVMIIGLGVYNVKRGRWPKVTESENFSDSGAS